LRIGAHSILQALGRGAHRDQLRLRNVAATQLVTKEHSNQEIP
jgi:hypothetical protein